MCCSTAACQGPVGPLPWEGSGGHPAATVSLPSTVKADKKAAQEKMIQQEHERQVRQGEGWRVSECRLGQPSLPPSLPSLPQEREDELRAMARKIRMK